MAGAAAFLVAPDKFKGTFTAAEVAALIAEGAAAAAAGAEAIELPVADGGDGTAESLLDALGGKWVKAPAVDVTGRPVGGRFALLEDGSRAVVELAAVAGLAGTDPETLDPMTATTGGAGMLVVAAVEAGAREIIFAPGGSASTDGGAGMLAVLDEAGLRPPITVACDVEHHFLEAATVFAPQKGADPDQVSRLTARLDRLASSFHRDPRGVPRTGCGGGVSGGLWANLDAKLVPGAELVLDAIGFDAALKRSVAVITGEGKLDDQTSRGKAVAAVAARARAAGVPAAAVVGKLDLDPDGLRSLGLVRVIEAGSADALREAGHRLGLDPVLAGPRAPVDGHAAGREPGREGGRG